MPNLTVPVSVVFYEAEAAVGVNTPFQIHFTAPKSSCLHLLPVKSLSIHFSDERPPLTVNHVEGENRPIYLANIAAESKTIDASLVFEPGITKVLYGGITSNTPRELKVSEINYPYIPLISFTDLKNCLFNRNRGVENCC